MVFLICVFFSLKFPFASNLNKGSLKKIYSELKVEYEKFSSYKKFQNKRYFSKIVRKIREIEGNIGLSDDNFYLRYTFLKALIFKRGGEVFKLKKYLIYSMKIFVGVYKNSRLRGNEAISRKSILELAEIYERDFDFKDRALYWYQKYIDNFPLSKDSKWIRRKIDSLSLKLSKLSDSDLFKIQRREFSFITDIRYWSSKKVTRIVVELDGPVFYTKNVLKSPYRVFVDFYNTYASPFFLRRAIVIERGSLKKIRVGQFKKNISRVVLDFDSEIEVDSFHLDNPFKVVLDVNFRKKSIKNKVTLAKINKKSGLHKKRNKKKILNQKKGDENLEVVVPPEKIDKKTLTRILGLKVGTIVIDPGHGGKDPGTIGYGGIKEKNVVLSIAKILKKIIEKNLGVRVIMTRNGDYFVPLEKRPFVANSENADIFISIHANSSRNDKAAGIETFYLGFTRNRRSLSIAAYENALSQKNISQLQDIIKKITLSEKLKESSRLAYCVNGYLWKTIRKLDPHARNRGVKKAPFVVLIGTSVPSVLVEIGFLSNEREARIISDRKNQIKIAKALYLGILKYLKEVGRIEKKTATGR